MRVWIYRRFRVVLQRSFHLEFTYLQPDQWYNVACINLKIINISNRAFITYHAVLAYIAAICYTFPSSLLLLSGLCWPASGDDCVLESCARWWCEKMSLSQLRHHLPSKRQDYQFIKSQGGQWHIHHEQNPNAFTAFRSYFNVLHKMPFHMGTIPPDFTSLIFVTLILF